MRVPLAAAWHASSNLRALALDVLRDRRYHLIEAAPAPQTWWQRLLGRFGAFLAGIWHALTAHVHVSGTQRGVLGAALLGIALLAMALVLWRALRSVQRDSASLAAVRALDRGETVGDVYAAASRAAQRGEFPTAVRLLFAAAIIALDLHGLLADDAGTTVGEFRRALRAKDAGAATDFDDLARLFTVIAYGDADADAATWERARGAYLALTARSG